MILDVDFASIFNVDGNALSPEKRIDEIIESANFNKGDCIRLDNVLCRTEEEFKREIARRRDN